MNALARKCLTYRQQHNLTQAQLAEKLDLTGGTISHIELGLSAPSAKSVKRLKAYFRTLETDRVPVVSKHVKVSKPVRAKTHRVVYGKKSPITPEFLVKMIYDTKHSQEKLKDSHNFTLRVMLVGFALLAALIYFK